ncbi:hypothetical protein D3C86_1673630 [compost metagenome]
MAWVNVDVVGRVLLDQGFLSFAELVRILVDVFGVNAKQWLFIFERINPKPAVGLETRRSGGKAALVSGDRAIGVTGLNRSELRQALTQVRGVASSGGCEATGRKTHQDGS